VFIPATYTESMVNYYAKYFKTCKHACTLKENGRIIGFWPGLIQNQVHPPIFELDVSKKVQRKHINDIMEYVDKYLSSYKIVDFSTDEISAWHQMFLERAIKFKTQYYHYIDFTKPHPIRKSYRSLCNQNMAKFTPIITVDPRIITEFRLKHIEVSGRETRSVETWIEQAASITDGEAFVVYIPNLAYSLFNYSKDECLYSVGVYDRNSKAPLGHLTLKVAIEYARDVLNCTGFNLGEAKFTGNVKEMSISNFKSGFANTLRPKFVSIGLAFLD
jgi:hypothetical protein